MLILSLLGVVQALLLAIALLRTKRGNKTANRILSAFATVIALAIAGVCLTKTRYTPWLYSLGKINQPITFLGAPLLYLYVRFLVSSKRSFDKRDLLHFLPAVLCLIFLIPFFIFFPSNPNNFIGRYYGATWYIVRAGLQILQFLVYLIVMIAGVVKYRKQKLETSEDAKLVQFKIRFLVATFCGLWFIGLVHYILTVVSPVYSQIAQADLIVSLGATLIVYALAYLSLREPAVLFITNDDLIRNPKKYRKSTLTAERVDLYLKRLFSVMESERPYSDGMLTLQKLAKRLSIPSHHLSQLLNEHLNQNFFDFVNRYRIEEAKKKLIEPSSKHYSILGIAEEVGFNSKSAFHTAFKKHTNMTPTAFRQGRSTKQPDVTIVPANE